MTTKEALLLKVMEECDELSQRCSKAARFTLEEIQEGQKLNNAQRIREEYIDLVGALQYLIKEGYINLEDPTSSELKQRENRINKYLDYSRKLGTITD